jgi:RHS repeat-associated protein
VLKVSQWLYTYNPDGLLASKTDPNGNRISYNYDGNRVIKATNPAAKTNSLTYPPLLDENGRTYTGAKTTNFVEDDGGEWTYDYDGKNALLTGKTDPYGNTTSYYYNPDRTERATTEPFDNEVRLTTFSTYDANGNLLTRTDPVDISSYAPAIDPATVDIASLATLNPPIRTATSYTYAYNVYGVDNNDQVATVTDHRGSSPTTTTYQYTVDSGTGDQLTTVTDPDNHVTVTRYHAAGPFKGSIKSVTDANGQVTAYAYYDDTPENRTAGRVGLLYEVATPDGVKTRYTGYDRNGNATEIRAVGADNREIRTVQSYDALNRLRTVTRYAQGYPDNVTTYAYDNNGNRTYQKDPDGKVTTFRYDHKGHVVKVTDAQAHDTQYLYGGTGGSGCTSCGGGDKLTAVIDAKQQTTGFEYDELGRLVLETDPLGKKIRYTYYDSGKVREKIDATTPPGKVLINYYYDTQGRLTRKQYADNTEETYTYDPKGRLATVANAAIGYTFAYYNNGWLKSVTDTNGKVISYDQYDGVGQKKQVTWFPGTPDQRQLAYGYDPANLSRLKSITSAAGLFTYGYDPLGRRNSLVYPNGIEAAYAYDDLDRLTSLTHSGGGSPFLTYGYTHDQAGNRKTRSGTVQESYDYDEVYRLKQAVTATGTKSYSYDAVGNRQTGPGPKDTGYRYDAANRMLSGKLFGYAYDNNGNQTARTVPNAPEKGWTLTWDYENRLTKMEQSKGTTEKRTITFKHDPMGRRIEKKAVTTVSGVTKTTTYTYVYDGDAIALETMTDGGVTTKTFYTHGPGVDEHLALERNGQYYYYHADGLGSVTAITDNSKAVVQSYTYDAFGMARAATGFVNSYTYTGREWDKETGLYFYRARYYDPMEGRFISKDPVSFAGGDVNLYAYVNSNTINNTDPMGLFMTNGDIAPPDRNTVVCDGKGGVMVQTGGTGDATQTRCFGDCVKQHEKSHRRDVRRLNPNICRGKKRGTEIFASDRNEELMTERKAYRVVFSCLNSKLCQTKDCECKQLIEDYIKGLEDYYEKHY